MLPEAPCIAPLVGCSSSDTFGSPSAAGTTSTSSPSTSSSGHPLSATFPSTSVPTSALNEGNKGQLPSSVITATNAGRPTLNGVKVSQGPLTDPRLAALDAANDGGSKGEDYKPLPYKPVPAPRTGVMDEFFSPSATTEFVRAVRSDVSPVSAFPILILGCLSLLVLFSIALQVFRRGRA